MSLIVFGIESDNVPKMASMVYCLLIIYGSNDIGHFLCVVRSNGYVDWDVIMLYHHDKVFH